MMVERVVGTKRKVGALVRDFGEGLYEAELGDD